MADDPALVHAHGVPDHDHVHDHEAIGPLEENPIWQQDNVVLHSVGIDVGSSGSQVIFSRLHLRRIGEDLSTRYVVVNRETVHRSPVVLTPYRDDDLIDAAALGGFVDDAYHAAGMTPSMVDTGVVILTGEALRRRNARRITDVLADRAGDLVCATAGHHLEARLAAFGSGAARRSYEQRERLLNIDVGGGTTKLAILERGQVVASAAIGVGGRLIATDPDGRIVRVEPSGRWHAARAGFDWQRGDRVEAVDLALVTEGMAELVVAALTDPVGEDPAAVGTEPSSGRWLTAPLGDLGDLDGVIFSGGVAEYVYEREHDEFGDLGPHLAAALRARFDRLPAPVLPAGECIRATAVGASEYSVQLSGNTSWVSNPDGLLPRRNLKVVRVPLTLGASVDPEQVAAEVRRGLAARDVAVTDTDVVVALPWSGEPSYERLDALAKGVVGGLRDHIDRGGPLYLVLDGDVARSLGRLLSSEHGIGNDLLVLDGLELWDFDYVDLGRLRHPSNTVPVTIKSLVFAETAPAG